MTIALTMFGPPGSGKSLLARQTSKELNLPYIGSGDVARQMAEQDTYTRTELGRGDWAPEIAMRKEILARIEEATITRGAFVIDGFPRRLEQLFILESVPDIQPLYFALDVDPLLCIRRMVMRRREGEDHGDAVALRWRNFQEYTEPMLTMLADHLITLDGSLEPELLVQMIVDEYNREVGR